MFRCFAVSLDPGPCSSAKEKNDSLTPDELSFCIADFLAENRESVVPILAHDPMSSERY